MEKDMIGYLLVVVGFIGIPFTFFLSLILVPFGIYLIKRGEEEESAAAAERARQMYQAQQAHLGQAGYQQPGYPAPYNQPQAYPAPYHQPHAAPAPQPQAPTPRCAKCGMKTEYSKDYDDYYCWKCKSYVSELE